MTGQVVHFEVPADDLDRAQAFYREAFGWEMRSMPEMSYTLVTTTPAGDNGMPKDPGAINGGMMLRGGPVTAPIITIEVDDIDAALAAVERLGGRTAVGRQPVGDMGWAAYFIDSEGNTVGLWQTA
jgi:predicted enzyme related to lactoylglutathione lyase